MVDRYQLFGKTCYLFIATAEKSINLRKKGGGIGVCYESFAIVKQGKHPAYALILFIFGNRVKTMLLELPVNRIFAN